MYLHIRVHPEARFYIPYLDGKELKDCISASEAGGWAVCHMKDVFGKYIVDWANDQILRIIKYGRIKLVDSRISSKVN